MSLDRRGLDLSWTPGGLYRVSTGDPITPGNQGSVVLGSDLNWHMANSDAAKLAAGGVGAVDTTRDPTLPANDSDWVQLPSGAAPYVVRLSNETRILTTAEIAGRDIKLFIDLSAGNVTLTIPEGLPADTQVEYDVYHVDGNTATLTVNDGNTEKFINNRGDAVAGVGDASINLLGYGAVLKDATGDNWRHVRQSLSGLLSIPNDPIVPVLTLDQTNPNFIKFLITVTGGSSNYVRATITATPLNAGYPGRVIEFEGTALNAPPTRIDDNGGASPITLGKTGTYNGPNGVNYNGGTINSGDTNVPAHAGNMEALEVLYGMNDFLGNWSYALEVEDSVGATGSN